MGTRALVRDAAPAAACALYAVLAGSTEIGWAALLPAVLVLVGLCVRVERPVWAMLAVLAAQLVVALAGLSLENPAVLPAELIAAYSVGRFTSRRVTWAVPIAVTLMVWVLDHLNPVRLLLGLIVMSIAWGFGRIVRVRSLAAQAAVAAEERARSLDPGVVSAQVVADDARGSRRTRCTSSGTR